MQKVRPKDWYATFRSPIFVGPQANPERSFESSALAVLSLGRHFVGEAQLIAD